MKFEVEFLQSAKDFLDRLQTKEREKILYNVRMASLKDDPELFKKIDDDIWEFRTLYNGKQFRSFAFWDKRRKNPTLVVVTHCIIKKTSKVPAKEVQRAKELMSTYLQQ